MGGEAKNLLSNAGDTGSIPSQATKIPYATGQLSLHVTITEPVCQNTEPACCNKHPERQRPDQPNKVNNVLIRKIFKILAGDENDMHWTQKPES